jgi:hypothetical protein
METYLVYSDLQSALDRSAKIASDLGCGQGKDDVTKYWYPVLENSLTKEAALKIETVEADGYAKLNVIEKASTTDKASLDLAGWFPARVLTDVGIEVEGIGGGGIFDGTSSPEILGIPVMGRFAWTNIVQPTGKAIQSFIQSL